MTDDSFPSSFEGIQQLVATLRSPDGCPWDREQSADSLKHLFLEECYELVEAIEEGDVEKIAEELGDVLFHGASQIQIAEERGDFSGSDVFQQVIEKLVRRHPHVFGDVVMENAEEAVPRWDEIKRQEMAGTDRSILDGVPKGDARDGICPGSAGSGGANGLRLGRLRRCAGKGHRGAPRAGRGRD